MRKQEQVHTGFTCVWHRMAQCRSRLCQYRLVGWVRVRSTPVVWPLNTRGLIGWQSCSHNTSASMHIFDIWLVSLLKDGTASPIPSVGQKWQRKPCQRQTLNFLELRLSKINPRTFLSTCFSQCFSAAFILQLIRRLLFFWKTLPDIPLTTPPLFTIAWLLKQKRLIEEQSPFGGFVLWWEFSVSQVMQKGSWNRHRHLHWD